MSSDVDKYLHKDRKWLKVMQKLRKICLNCDLSEDLKWGKPTYSYKGSNIAIIQGFKNSCAFMFFKGALLNDTDEVLEKPGKNSRSARRIQFTSEEQVAEIKSTIEEYIYEAIEVEKAGLKIKPRNKEDIQSPEELLDRFENDQEYKKAFEALTPGRQKGYLLYFSDAKQSKTRSRRIDKYRDKIFKGKGKNER